MTPCEAVEVELSAYLDGELSAEERIGLESHLRTCSSCQNVLADLKNVKSVLSSIPKSNAPVSLASKIHQQIAAAPVVVQSRPQLQAIDNKSTKRSLYWGSVLLGIAAMLLLSLLMTIVLPVLSQRGENSVALNEANDRKAPAAEDTLVAKQAPVPTIAPMGSDKPIASVSPKVEEGQTARDLKPDAGVLALKDGPPQKPPAEPQKFGAVNKLDDAPREKDKEVIREQEKRSVAERLVLQDGAGSGRAPQDAARELKKSAPGAPTTPTPAPVASAPPAPFPHQPAAPPATSAAAIEKTEKFDRDGKEGLAKGDAPSLRRSRQMDSEQAKTGAPRPGGGAGNGVPAAPGSAYSKNGPSAKTVDESRAPLANAAPAEAAAASSLGGAAPRKQAYAQQREEQVTGGMAESRRGAANRGEINEKPVAAKEAQQRDASEPVVTTRATARKSIAADASKGIANDEASTSISFRTRDPQALIAKLKGIVESNQTHWMADRAAATQTLSAATEKSEGGPRTVLDPGQPASSRLTFKISADKDHAAALLKALQDLQNADAAGKDNVLALVNEKAKAAGQERQGIVDESKIALKEQAAADKSVKSEKSGEAERGKAGVPLETTIEIQIEVLP